ncbi:MAG: hypothetical protein KGY57_02410 [Gammaproteobacteria bacterium]|nr:hypothetical protein [Gammaproteobacteria bacterium]
MMNIRTFTLIVAALVTVAVASQTATANTTNFSYSSLSVSAINVSFDDDVVIPRGGFTNQFVNYSSTTGAGLSGSLQLENNLILGISSTYLSDSKLGTEVEESNGSLSVGYATAISNAADFVVTGSFVSSEVEVCNLTACASDDETGFGLSGAFRYWASNNLELNASVSYVDLGDFGDSTAFGAGGAFWFDDHSSLTLALSTSSDATATSIGYRYAF